MELDSVGQTEGKKSLSCKCGGVRHLFVLAAFLGMCIIFALRVNMNIAILAMLNNTAVSIITGSKNLTNGTICGLQSNSIQKSPLIEKTKEGPFVWTPKMQGVIIGSFYYGYVLTNIPGARLSEIYSGRWVFGLGIGISALLSLFIPPAANLSTAFLVFVRALQGLAQGVAYPAMYNLLGRWTPEQEKTLVEAFILSGNNIGTVVGMPLAAELINCKWCGGWPSAFYLVGLIGCVWFVFWILCVTNSPSEHQCITSSELEYITSCKPNAHETKSIPWLKILTFGPYWAVVFAQFVGDWTFFLMLNNLPAFYATILNFDIESNGFMSSFPYIIQTLIGCFAGFISDQVIKRGLATPTLVRKLSNTLGCFGSIAGLVISSAAGCNITLQITSFSITIASGGLWYSSYLISFLDISPEYAGSLMGISNSLSSLGVFMTPIIVGALTDKKPTFGQWRIVFMLTIILLIVDAIVYQLYATADKQNWNDEHHTKRSSRYRRCLNYIFRIRTKDANADLEKNE